MAQGQGQALAGARGPAVVAGQAQRDGAVRILATLDDSRGWEAVGRLDLGESGFCTGALIEDNLVLTAAHCLFDKDTGARIPADRIKFLAGWRNGRAAAYRSARRAVTHPQYVYEGRDRMDRVVHDIALIELDHPVRLTTIQPFPVGKTPAKGDTVGIVSYAHDRAEVPSLQRTCHVLDGQPGVLVLSCAVDFGSSGAPIFAFGQGGPQIVSIVSAKAEYDGDRVALGSVLDEPLAALRAEMAHDNGVVHGATGLSTKGGADNSASGGAKFLRP